MTILNHIFFLRGNGGNLCSSAPIWELIMKANPEGLEL